MKKRKIRVRIVINVTKLFYQVSGWVVRLFEAQLNVVNERELLFNAFNPLGRGRRQATDDNLLSISAGFARSDVDAGREIVGADEDSNEQEYLPCIF